jgi:steroid delta-isomerase-like uncharacterized protein
MAVDDGKAVARRALEGVWSVDGGVAAEDVWATEIVSHQHSHPTVDDVVGLDALKGFVAEFHQAFPDFTDQVDRQVAEDDVVVTQFTSSGTQLGEFLGIAATGRRAEWMGIEIARIDNGKIAENWVSWDMYGMLQQLGALPGAD